MIHLRLKIYSPKRASKESSCKFASEKVTLPDIHQVTSRFSPTEVEVENDVAAILQSSGTTGKMCAKKTFTFVGYHKNPERTLEVFEAGGFKYTGKQPLSGGIYLVKSIKMNVSGKMVHREMQKFVKNIYKKFKTRKFGMSRRSSYDFNLLLHK